MATETAPDRPAALTSLTDEEVMFSSAVAEFAELEVRPRVQAMERAGRLDPALIPQLFSLGLMGIEVPEQYGGADGSVMMVALAVEAISRVDAAAAIMVDVQNTLVNYPITRYGSDDIKSRYLPRLTSCTVGAYALSEPSSGSDAFGLQTSATRSGSHFVLNGRKMWITNGAEAEVFVVFANADRAAGYKGITAFIVERNFPGFNPGNEEHKMGIHGSSTTPIFLENCKVPKENVLHEIGRGHIVAFNILNAGRFSLGAYCTGGAKGTRFRHFPTKSDLVTAVLIDRMAQLRLLIDPVFLPRPLLIVDELPRNATGKLPQQALQGFADQQLRSNESQ